MAQTVEVNFSETPKPVKKTPAPAPAAGTTPPAQPTPEELEAEATQAFEAMGWGAPPPPKPVNAPAPVVEDPPAPPAAAAPAAPATPEPVVEPPPAAEPVMTQDEVIRRTADATADAISRRQPPAAPPAPAAAAPAFEMIAEDQDDFQAIQFLERTNPSKYTGAAAKYLDYVKRHYEYQRQWLNANPGKPYNAEDDEHTAWYDQNPAPVTMDEVEKAKTRMMVEEEVIARVQPQLEKINSERALEVARPAITQNLHNNVVAMVDMVNPSYGKLLRDSSGKASLSKDNIAKLETEDPIAYAILDRLIGSELRHIIIRLEEIAAPGSNLVLDPANNPIDRGIDYFRDLAEKDMLAAPAEVRIQDGREFATRSQMQAFREAINRSSDSPSQKQSRINELENRYWQVGVDEVEAKANTIYAERARKMIEEQDGLAKKKYGAANGNGQRASTPASGTPTQPQPIAATPSGKPRSPSAAGASDIVVTQPGGVIPEKKEGEVAVKEFFS